MEPQTNLENYIHLIKKAGLNDGQAKAYLTLIERGKMTPVDLSEEIGESRTNAYMICEKLSKFGLITKMDAKKTIYSANHPSSLETLAEKRRKVIQRNELDVKTGINPLIDLFYAATEMPGARILEGVEGIKEVYNDTLRTKENIYLFRSRADIPFLGEDFFKNYRYNRAKNGIKTYSLTPLSPEGMRHVKNDDDEKLLYNRTFIPSDDYTAPVEIDIYGDKVALLAFGSTQMATIINSPLIADALRQIHQMLTKSYAEFSESEIAKIKKAS